MMLAGGHPNSLGRTGEVVQAVLADRTRLDELFRCYRSADPVVRLRTSSSIKRLEAVRHAWLLPFVDHLIDDVGLLDQASARWTLAHLLLRLAPDLTTHQRARAEALLKRNLVEDGDWIVLINTMETLAAWAAEDAALQAWLQPRLARLAADPRRSVAARARKLGVSAPPRVRR